MIKSLKSIKEQFLIIKETFGFDKIVYTIDENSDVNRLKDALGLVLLVNYPVFKRKGGQDNPTYLKSFVFWICKKARTGNYNDDQEDEEMDVLLGKTQSILEYMEEQASTGGCTFFSRIEWETIEINPFYRQIGGFNGWAVEMLIG